MTTNMPANMPDEIKPIYNEFRQILAEVREETEKAKARIKEMQVVIDAQAVIIKEQEKQIAGLWLHNIRPDAGRMNYLN